MEGLGIHPVFVIVAAGTLVCVFARAVVHKVSDFSWFAHTLTGYKLLPEALTQPVAVTLVALEALVIIGLTIPSLRVFAALLALALLILYATAIALNLLRGNMRIDCGCGGAGQGLSWFLVLRNAVLGAIALVAAATPLAATLDILAWISVVTGIASLMLAEAGADQLNENWSWLSAADEQSHQLHPQHDHGHDHGEETN
jgi:hypothetical protein